MKRAFLACIVFLLLGVVPCLAEDVKADAPFVNMPTSEGLTSVQTFLASGPGKHPAVILLHGAQGLARHLAYYQRMASALAAAGMDAYVFTYYSAADAAQIETPAQRRALFSQRVQAWSKLVSDVAGNILADGRSSGRVGVLGFSQGGYLATAVASQDARIAALGVFYGGISGSIKGKVEHLPPLLELHGDADQVVPLSEGQALADLTRGLGQSVDMTVYPGAGHGFNGADAVDAQKRVIAFFRKHLAAQAR